VNVALRSGANAFHGSAYFQFTNDSLNATDRGYWQRSVANVNIADSSSRKKDGYSLLYPGGTSVAHHQGQAVLLCGLFTGK